MNAKYKPCNVSRKTLKVQLNIMYKINNVVYSNIIKTDDVNQNYYKKSYS